MIANGVRGDRFQMMPLETLPPFFDFSHGGQQPFSPESLCSVL